ncbi:hypothetical protein niasHT_001514 [Heterodera trifolii]|uniref:Effector protein n=1 Tax=Heterodera trifolii TaxID=157864 RepID=A0ABD2M680_9BILA
MIASQMINYVFVMLLLIMMTAAAAAAPAAAHLLLLAAEHEVNCPCGSTHCYCCGKSEIFGTNHFCGCGEEKRIICEDNATKCQLCGKCTLYGNVKDPSSSTNKDIPSTSTKGRKGKEKAAEVISDDLAQKLKEMRLKM